MTPEEIQEYNQAYIETCMEYYAGDGITPGDDENIEEIIDLVEHIAAPKVESRSSKRSWMLYERSEENYNVCRNCPRRKATGRCPLTPIEQSSCDENGYHRHPFNAELRIKETMPNE